MRTDWDGITFTRSLLVPFIKNERHNDRHRRRLVHALLHIRDVQKWCIERDIDFRFTSNFEFSFFYYREKEKQEGEPYVRSMRFVWQPFRGRLRYFPIWQTGKFIEIKAFDYEQVLFYIYEKAMR